MNYIKQLQLKNEELQKKLDEADAILVEKMKYLCSEKFQGMENNYVNATEALNMLYIIRNTIAF